MGVTAGLWQYAQLWLGAYLLGVKLTAIIVSFLIAVSSLDDILVDLWFWVREAYRALVIRQRYPRLAVSSLVEKQEQRLAIMVPAWREDDVIAAMVDNAVRVLDYENYVIFVGAYPNDPATQAEIERMTRRFGQVVQVICTDDGPTSKADCLNHIIEAALQFEVRDGREFAGFVLHDAEDVLHALELKFFNYLLPRKDLIQLPVVSLERGLSELVAGTYMDEFAEWHAKDLVVRESFARAVPSAGVGTCLSRRAVLTLRNVDAQVFNPATLTEDYDVGSRLAEAGLSSIIARYPVDFQVRRRGWLGLGPPREQLLRMPLSVREYFPNTFMTSYRQKARWTIGIALQGWAQVGWRGSWREKYFLARDRKALVTPVLAIAAYFLLVNFVLFEALGLSDWVIWRGVMGDVLRGLLAFNLIALILRVGQRFYFVTRLYGPLQGLASAPRMVVASFVNFSACMRALRLWGSHLLFGRRIVWDKTMHQFPSSATLARTPRRLGEILLGSNSVSETQIGVALSEQAVSGRALGRILLAHGWLDEDTLADAIAMQSNLPRGTLGAAAVLAHREFLPAHMAIRLGAVVVGHRGREGLVVAVAQPLDATQQRFVAKATGAAVFQRVVTESEIAGALRLLATGEFSPRAALLGALLVERGDITQPQLDAALESYLPDRDGRLGQYLVRRGVLRPRALEEALRAQAARLELA